MNEVIELHQLIGAVSAGSPPGIVVTRTEKNGHSRLPGNLRKQVDQLGEMLAKAIPDDFNFTLSLGGESPLFHLSYADGIQTEMWVPLPLLQEQSVFTQLQLLDWEASRGDAIASCQIFDDMREHAAQQPTRLPSTAKGQAAFQAEVSAFCARMSANPEGTRALFWHELEGFPEMEYPNLAAMAAELPNLITCDYRALAVIENGKHLSFSEIDSLNQAAYDGLSGMPLSQARAACKFGDRPYWDA